MLMRLLPAAVMTAGLYKGMDKFKPLLESANVVRAQMELRSINQLLTAEALTEKTVEPSAFPAYLRRNLVLQASDQQRDTSLDPWGNVYQLRIEPGRWIVVSAGPDKEMGTPDDLQTSVRLD
jgi:hypothetical protein